MSDENVIAAFMEPRPTRKPKRDAPDYGCGISAQTWWIYSGCEWVARDLTLDALHEVESRLTDAQWLYYEDALVSLCGKNLLRRILHASAADKVKALAAVLRPIVEATQKEKVSA